MIPKAPSYAETLQWANALRQTQPGVGREANPEAYAAYGGTRQTEPQGADGTPSIEQLYRYYLGRDPSSYERHYYMNEKGGNPMHIGRDLIEPGQRDGTSIYTFENRQGTPYRGAITPIDQRQPLPGMAPPQGAPQQPAVQPTPAQQSVIDYFRLGFGTPRFRGTNEQQQRLRDALRGYF